MDFFNNDGAKKEYFLDTDKGRINYTVVRVRRKTIGISVDENGNVQIRIPKWCPLWEAHDFVKEKADWILKAQTKMEQRQENRRDDWDDVRAETYPWIRLQGGKLFRNKVAAWAEKMGVEYSKITIKDVSTRWGSCSDNGSLSFSWKVFVMPERMVDYLIVHELAHIRHMDHSHEFWELVGTYIPDYKRIRKEFKNYI